MIQAMDELSFRPYRPTDLDACAQIAADAWPFASSLVPEGDFPQLMRGFIELARLPSTRLEVACISDEVAGLLFAWIESESTVAHSLRMLLVGVAIGARAVLGAYGRIKHPIALLRDGIATGSQVNEHRPKAGAIVELFAVSADHRRQGIGKALMDRFVSAARDRDMRRIALHSDEMCSWGFYEAYGFQRWATFREILSSRLTGEDKMGFVYVMELKPHLEGTT